MDLLPKCHTEFDSPEYWDKFFKRRGSKTFEWYGEYPQLCGVLHKYIKIKDKILVVGCGNSQLSADLYDVGITNLVNIDVSDVVIRQMTDKNKERSKMSFVKMDVTQMPCEEGEFSVVLDKGTLDALMVNTETEVVNNINKMFSEIMRVLKLGGRYICISLLQDHILKKLLSYFTESGWPIRIHRINTESTSEFQLPVFAVVCTKFKKMEGMKQILEVSTFESKIERLETVEALTKVVKEMQYYGILREQLSNNSMSDHQLSLSLYNELANTPRYTLYIVDGTQQYSNKFAIFIVPQGRETDWLFSSDKGRLQLSDSAGYQRLVVVTLDRNHTYNDIESIQAELSGKVMELAPPSYKSGTKVPFLSLGGDIGQRHIRQRYTSDISGECIVEDVTTDQAETFRRLIFLSNEILIQSEARLLEASAIKSKKRNKSKFDEMVIDKSYLACQHHLTMIGGLAFLPNIDDNKEPSATCLIIGLGGGALTGFLHQHLTKTKIDVVDIDATIVDIARQWFGFKDGDNLKVHVDNGIDFIKIACDEGKKYDVVMFDIDNKDKTVGLTCPPAVFLEKDFLLKVSALLSTSGIFVLNLVCRDEELKKELMTRIKTVFTSVYYVNIDDEVNDIVYALNQESDAVCPSDKFIKTVQENVGTLNQFIKRNATKKSEINLLDAMEKLKVG